MIQVKSFVFNMLQENCYIVSDDTREAVVIDCGAYYDAERQAVVNYIREHQLTVRHLLCTHGHFDHCFGNDTVWHAFGVGPEISEKDSSLMDLDAQMRSMMGVGFDRESVPVQRFFDEVEVITFGNHRLQVLPTPGHTPGGVCFYCEEEKLVFTGDTLFYMSVGRTDFDGGSWNDLHDSLTKVLAKLPTDTTVLPGHGPRSRIGQELRMNPYLR